MIRLPRLVLLVALALAAPRLASAQTPPPEPPAAPEAPAPIGEQPPPYEIPQGPPPPPPAPPAAPTPAYDRDYDPGSDAERPIPDQASGLDYVVERWGFTLLRTDTVVHGGTDSRGAAAVIDSLGIRYWTNNRFAIDAGVGALVVAPDSLTPAWVGLSAVVGLPIAIAQWPHVTAYLKPQLSGYFVRFEAHQNRFQIAGSALAGAELHLGWLHMPAVSLAAEGGLEVAFNGGRNPSPGGSFTGNSLRVVRPATLETLVRNIALRIYF